MFTIYKEHYTLKCYPNSCIEIFREIQTQNRLMLAYTPVNVPIYIV